MIRGIQMGEISRLDWLIGFFKHATIWIMKLGASDAFLKNTISPSSLDISPIWIPLMIYEMTKSEESPQQLKFPLVYSLNPSSSVLS
jgi:hypothetical protein